MRYKQKREIVLLPHNELAETSFLILVFTEINQRAKSDYVTKLPLLSNKNIYQIASKILKF